MYQKITLAILATLALTACDKAQKIKAVLQEDSSVSAPQEQSTAQQAPTETLYPVQNGQIPQDQAYPNQQAYPQQMQQAYPTQPAQMPAAPTVQQQYPAQQAGMYQEQALLPEAQVQKQPMQQAGQVNERIVRYTAKVVTQEGSNVMVRKEPNRSAQKLTYLYDSEIVTVTGETNVCETIGRLNGCWVRVIDSAGATGYVFNAFLKR